MQTNDNVLIETAFAHLPLFKRGKVRDIYQLDAHLLIVATDRISVFDVVLPTGIPKKGKVLTALSEFWFRQLAHLVPSHFVTTDITEMGNELAPYADVLSGRSMMVRKAHPLPVECVVRSYLAGWAWKEYQNTGRLLEVTVPRGLRECEKLPKPVFTPATKAPSGHDLNIPLSQMTELIGEDISKEIIEKSLSLFKEASDYALRRGVIIADTKFEWGILEDSLILIDEIFTPDSSRFWPLEGYRPGRPQPSLDKQYIRDYLEATGWDKTPPGPSLPGEVVKKTTEKYLEVCRTLTGRNLS